MFLNSVILGNILNHEKCELKNSIDAYMDSKIKDFQVIMKKSVDDIINTKVNTFCNKPFDKHVNALFDKDGSKIIEEYNHYARDYNHRNPTNSDYFKLKTIPITNNIKCFELAGPPTNSHDNGGTCYFFQNFMIERKSKRDGWGNDYKYSEYDLTIDKLFTIKYFQMNMRYGDSSVTNKECFRIHKSNPEYFKKSYSELDEKKEYIELEKLMGELKILIDDNKQKKEYYESLEKRNIELEAEVKQLQNKATEIDEIKSLLKDQQEYALIIQSLLKRINKLESKAIEK
jgi:hypothetical protein